MASGESTIAGYRLVRTLGHGHRASVHLGHAATDGAAGHGVALKVFPRRTAADATAEVAILTSVRAPCVPSLIDIASLADGSVCLILERLAGPVLSQWLAQRRKPPGGELVTVIAPLVATAAALHADGWAFGRLHPSAVRLTSDGRPVITSFAAAVPLDPPGARSRSAAELLRADHSALAELIGDVFALAETDDPGFASFLGAAAAAAVLEDPLPELEERLFAWAEPLALRLDGGPSAPSVASHLAPSAAPAAGPSAWPTPSVPGGGGAEGQDRPAPREPALVTTAEEGAASSVWARLAAAADVSWRARGLEALRGMFARHRLAAVVALTAAALLTWLALALVPGETGTAAQPAAAPRRSPAAGQPSVDPTIPPTGTSAAPADAAVLGDDPVAAAHALLSARLACLDGGPDGCLSRVDAPGSPAAEADASAIRTGADQLSLPAEAPAVITLADRAGDAAIVLVSWGSDGETPPAPLLLMKGGAGWRLREVFEG